MVRIALHKYLLILKQASVVKRCLEGEQGVRRTRVDINVAEVINCGVPGVVTFVVQLVMDCSILDDYHAHFTHALACAFE